MESVQFDLHCLYLVKWLKLQSVNHWIRVIFLDMSHFHDGFLINKTNAQSRPCFHFKFSESAAFLDYYFYDAHSTMRTPWPARRAAPLHSDAAAASSRLQTLRNEGPVWNIQQPADTAREQIAHSCDSHVLILPPFSCQKHLKKEKKKWHILCV